eukprot:209565_1
MCIIICIPLIILIYIIITIYVLIYLYIICDSILFTYPICIFQNINDNLWINSKGFDIQGSNKWNNVMKYMNNSINKYDYSLRLYLLNYSFFILNQKQYPQILLKKIQRGIKWYITDIKEPQIKDNN